MRMKKTGFSYVLWLPGTVLTGILLAACITSAAAGRGLEKIVTAGIVCVSFALLTGLFLAGRKAVCFLAGARSLDSHTCRMLECFVGLCLFAGTILIRLYCLQSLDGLPEGGPWFSMAQVSASGGIPPIPHGASYVYTAALSGLFKFFGNKVAAGVFFQFFLQILLFPALYFGVRLFSGPLPALAAAAVLAFAPVYTRGMLVLTPENLYLLLYALGLLFLGLCVHAAHRKEYRNHGALFGFLLTGLYAGILTWMDLSGITLLFFALTAPLSLIKKREQGRSAEQGNSGKPWLLWTVFLMGLLLAFGLLLSVDAAYSRISFTHSVRSWLSSYDWDGGFALANLAGRGLTGNGLAGGDGALVTGLVLYGLAALYQVGFLFLKTQKSDAFSLCLCALSPACAFGIGRMDYSPLLSLIWAVFAGLGLSCVLEAGGLMTEAIDSSEGADRQLAAGSPAQATAAPAAVSVSAATATVPVPAAAAAATASVPAAPAAATAPERRIDHPPLEIVDLSKEDDGFVPIPNPLPLPKKHEKKSMDFGIEPEGRETDFDLLVAEEDDFDLV